MALRQHQQLKQTQRLSPLQMQVIKLIELNSIELEEKIKQELEENPALDEGIERNDMEDDVKNEDDYAELLSEEEIVKGDYTSDEDMPDFRLSTGQSSNFEQPKTDFAFSGDHSLHQSLIDQINLRKISEQEKKIAQYIIGNLDENGYLESTLQSISDDLIFKENIDTSPTRIEQILKKIQNLEPAGVGARNLQECLLLQLRRKEQTEVIKNATQILEEQFDEFTKKHYDKIKRQLSFTYDDLKNAVDEIISLNPKPGNTWGDTMEMAMANITPDFIVELDGQEVTMWLNNRNIPPLHINKGFSDMLKGYAENKKSMSNDNKQALLFMKQKVDSARWFVDAIKQRQNTLKLTMETIISLQYDFFITGDEAMLKPMILKDVAEKTGFDISTISRVSNSKYVQTHAGVFPLKFFFSEAMQTDDGEDISSREVKIILKQKIENENPSKPLTDEEATKMLNDKGYVIARRTVAKYREQLGIPVARLRKKL
ncbi:MAG: RNA polymerase factor sigma-54 [Dysgonamonadaceae bacterium]|nr:RNA polymerase factor sigma-54 [Dysgonamonadaceae bacterium]MDD4727845.1 RNA polymerase factor sigma-54 [Dysgonamonadaceae bacterium]